MERMVLSLTFVAPPPFFLPIAACPSQQSVLLFVTMAGPNLELFKFGMYLFFPLAVMVHYGDPEWYHRNVLPIRDQFWPKEESLYRPPRTSDDVRTALDEMKQKRLVRRQERLQLDQAQAQSANTNTETTEPKVVSMLKDAARTNQRLV
ncbi:glyoxylate/hydroxypyruvate reductase [Moesziomyces antarcticus T-34]|uniref:Glyoxylate/hydroxypyruvate reductase n=1 Tax=Pseudozyma antarctica (strain T-34) TaxID=1151754 RepID=M9MB57_PSEA3|nr:glyoxylate/hydroxypyruvate reductase [Moesziomyces antarcticus T-34]